MSSTLDDLFQQIIQSEQLAQQRKNLLNEVKAEIEKVQFSIQETDSETDALKGKVLVKTQQLNDEELNLKWLTSREIILRTQSQKFQSELEALEQRLLQSRNSSSEEYENFCVQTREFTKGYSLVENGQAIRTDEASQSLANVLQEVDQLEKDLQIYNDQKAVLVLLEEQKEAARARLDLLLAEENDLNEKLKEEQGKVESLLQDEKQVSEIPQHANEFTKLHKELDAVKVENYEVRCQKLQQELQQIQQCLWQKQLKRNKLPAGRRQRVPDPLPPQPFTPQKSNVLKVTNFSAPKDGSSQLNPTDKPSRDETYEADITGEDFPDLFCEDFMQPPQESSQNRRK